MRSVIAACLLFGIISFQADARVGTPAAASAADRCTGGAVPDETMITCLQDQFEQNDRVLNRVYRQALASRRGANAKLELRASQRAWLKSTKSVCEAAGSEFAADSAVQVAVEDCYNKKTVARTTYLKQLGHHA